MRISGEAVTDLFESAERVNFFGDLRKSKIGKDCPCCGRFAKFYRHKFDDKLYGFEGGEVFACHCYGEHFNYRELMNG